MEQINTRSPINKEVEEYILTKIKLLKYKAIDKTSAFAAEVISDILTIIIMVVAFIFLSITLALLAAYILRSAWEGFGCITILYGFILLVVKVAKIKLQNRFINILIQKVLNKN